MVFHNWQAFRGVWETIKISGQKIVFTNGCFDILHAGHVSYLEKAKSLGDVLIVGLNSDESVRKLKGPHRPIVPQWARARVLSSLRCVDYVVIFSEPTPAYLIQLIRPDVLVKGGDYSIDQIVGADYVASYGGLVTTIDLLPGFSTTNIVNQILNSDSR